MTSMREEANHASLSSQQLKWLITDKLTSHQAEAEKLAQTLANKRSGGSKCPRADPSHSPPFLSHTEKEHKMKEPKGPIYAAHPRDQNIKQNKIKTRNETLALKENYYTNTDTEHTHRYHKHSYNNFNPSYNILPLH